ncbi:DUF5686 and carboxypeptidase regulatory-like domain-containing protein [Flavobacteriales bacterium]|nr:DUF5686 and carboxypeptidase regulatory-like domain-containing protein [Flavobacteriales bacterium]
MKKLQLNSPLIACLFFTFCFTQTKAQLTKVKGKVLDEFNTPMPFVNISFINSNVGTITDFDGMYFIETKWAKDSLTVSFVGYTTSTQKIIKNKNQTINFKLKPNSIKINTIDIVEKKKVKYKNKENPAVDLIRAVIKHKDNNHRHAFDYYECDKYEKVEFDLNNFSEKIIDNKLTKEFRFVFENYVDTSEVNGKPFIPFFIRENISKVYFRKNPSTQKEYLFGTKMSGHLNRLDNDGIGHLMKKLYSDINIYDNQILLFGNYFPSPINAVAPNIYKFFIIDTLAIDGEKCINLGFSPRSKSDFAFTGNLFIVNDGTFAIRKVEMGINTNINLNFVNDLQIAQDFEKINDSKWMLKKNNLFIDYSFSEKQIGILGKKTVSYQNYHVNKARNDTIYEAKGYALLVNNKTEISDSYWKQNRHEGLSDSEEGIYTMIDSIQNTKTFKLISEASSILTSGWIDCDWYELGTIATFISWNKIEGLKLRMGGRTTPNFNTKFQLKGHVAIGLGDLRIKYLGGIRYALNDNLMSKPEHNIYTSLSRRTMFPGQYSENLDLDNFLLSFNSTNSDKMILMHKFKLGYVKEFESGLSMDLNFKNKRIRPLGNLVFENGFGNKVYNIDTDECTIKLRYAPNEQYYQTKNSRRRMINKNPVFVLNHTLGFKGFFNGEYHFSKSSFKVIKRMYLPLMGYSDINVEVGKFWGQAPFILLQIPIANQSLGYQKQAFNTMKFMEFVNDEYISMSWTHFFKGAIFNKLPLLKHLKVREVVGVKMLYGRLSDLNNPSLHYNLLRLPTDLDGSPSTHIMNRKPFIEVNFGVTNIFKFIRVDMVRRLNYLDDKYEASDLFGQKGLALRVSAKFDF